MPPKTELAQSPSGLKDGAAAAVLHPDSLQTRPTNGDLLQQIKLLVEKHNGKIFPHDVISYSAANRRTTIKVVMEISGGDIKEETAEEIIKSSFRPGQYWFSPLEIEQVATKVFSSQSPLFPPKKLVELASVATRGKNVENHAGLDRASVAEELGLSFSYLRCVCHILGIPPDKKRPGLTLDDVDKIKHFLEKITRDIPAIAELPTLEKQLAALHTSDSSLRQFRQKFGLPSGSKLDKDQLRKLIEFRKKS